MFPASRRHQGAAFSFPPFLAPSACAPPKPPRILLRIQSHLFSVSFGNREQHWPANASATAHIPKENMKKGRPHRPHFILLTGFISPPCYTVFSHALHREAEALSWHRSPPSCESPHFIGKSKPCIGHYFSIYTENSNRKPMILPFFGESHDMKPIHFCQVLQKLLLSPDISPSALTGFHFFCYNCTKLWGLFLLLW